MKSIRYNVYVLLIAIGTVGCGDDNGTGPTDTGPTDNVSFSIGVPSPTLSKPAGLTGLSAGITLTRVRLLLEEIELESVLEDSFDFEIGPLVIDLNLSGVLANIGVGSIPIGTHDELEFEVDKLDDDEGDPNDPQFADFRGTDISIIIEGIFNAENFTLSIEEDFEQEIELFPNIVIASNTASTNLSLLVNVDNWFIGNDPSVILDPTDPTNIQQIEANIKTSFEVFEDDDGDGELDFEGEVITVSIAENSFTLSGGLIVHTDESTIFTGSINSLQMVADLRSQGKEIKADGEGSKQPDRSILASEVEFKEED